MHTNANGPTSLPSICATKVDPQRNAAKISKKLYPIFAIVERKIEISIFHEMNKVLLLLVWLVVFVGNASATFVAILETAADASAKEKVSLSDRQYLTNVLREQAVLVLPAEQDWTIMTRENIQQMLPPGKSVEECEGSCIVETGKNIAAEYVCQARVGSFGEKLTLSAELYETAGNKLIASFNGRGGDVEELLKVIEEKSPAFFRRVKDLSQVKDAPSESVNTVAVETEVLDTDVVDSVDAEMVNNQLLKNPNYHTHNGFFFSFGLTFGYSYVRYSYTSDRYGESGEDQFFKGVLIPYGEVRLGWSAKMLTSFAMVGVGYGRGSYEYNHGAGSSILSYTVDANAFRFLSGLGIEFYLIQDKENIFYGLFLGVSLGYVYDRVAAIAEPTREYNSFFARFEAGKDWWFSNYWSIGAALNYTMGSFPDDFNSSHDEHRSYGCHTFGLTVRVAY
jgi:hypothetical protein